jgi:GH25 family lysozyme M1 (1,4-beta-N-acetylmuramidase)
MNKKLIVDISFYDDNNETPEGVDFVKMKTRADGVIIRAGQNKWIDPDFRTNWKAAKEAGILRYRPRAYLPLIPARRVSCGGSSYSTSGFRFGDSVCNSLYR